MRRLCATTVAACLVSVVTTGQVVLSRNGEVGATIVVPTEAEPTIDRAAAELQRYLSQVTGAKFATVREGQPVRGVELCVGCMRHLSATERALLTANPEQTLILVGQKRVTLCGGSTRGTLLAVYRFLEQAVGCRWLAPGLDFVPSRPTLSLAPMRMASAPAFELRVFVGRTPEAQDWGFKVGWNGYYDRESSATNGNCYYLPKELPSCHTYYRVIPSDTYFEPHPEWFPFMQGKRLEGRLHGGQLCVTSAGLAREFARNIIAVFDQDPNCRITSISPNDGRGWCECTACAALDEKLCGSRTTKQGLAGERPFRGDRVFWFANQVAARVAEPHPDKLLLVLAYINYAEPPDTVKPLPNVVPYVCHYAPADYSRPIADPTSEPNRQFNELLTAWAKSAPHLLYYGYVSKSMWWSLPRPVVRPFAADVKHLHALGIRRYYAQSSLRDWALDGPLYYVIGKLLWDPALDPAAVAADWTQHMFGRSAEQMTAFYRAVDESVRATGQSYSDSPPRHVPGLYEPALLEQARGHVEAALAAADTPAAQERVKAVRDVFTYGYWMVKSLEAMHSYRTNGDFAALPKVKEYGEKALELRQTREAKRFLASVTFVTDFGVVAEGFGQEEQRGGRRCWNSDETGLGDNRAGWATFFIEVPDAAKPVDVALDVWGESQLSNIVINTGGLSRGYSDGGIWTPVTPLQALSGEPKWERLVFRSQPEVYAPGKAMQKIGFGGADSQVWIAHIEVGSAGGGGQ